jgi:streptogramin lyase
VRQTRFTLALRRSRLNPATWLAVALPLVLLGAGLTGAIATSQVQLLSGAAWLASAQGQVILVSGSAARRIAAFPVSPPNTDLSVTQTNDAVFLVNRTESIVSRLDGATFNATRPLPVPGAAGRLQVLADGERLHVLDGQTGLIHTLDSRTLNPLRPQRSLEIQVDLGGAAVDQTGRIWAVDAQSGLVRWFDDDGSPAGRG